MFRSLALLAVLPTVFAHFHLQYPVPLGDDDDNEATGPCGGYPVVFGANNTNITVGGFAVALESTHPQANIFYKYTLDTAEPYTWSNISAVAESGLGSFCLPQLSVPQNLTGKRGVIQVTQQAVDGNLYAVSQVMSVLMMVLMLQCAAVNFIQGSTASPPSVCTNSSGVTAQALGANGANATSTGTASKTSSTAAKSSGAAVHNVVGGLLALVPAGFLLL